MAGKTHTFIISDESVVNSYGLRVMTSGIDIKQYKRNPVILWWHKRSKPWSDKNAKDDALPIGKAVKLWKEDGKLYADIEFDGEDEFAVKIEGKVARGFINMCSPGLDPITVSDDPKHLLPGQTRATLVKSNLEEISIVDIGSNKNALRLNLGQGDINEIIPLINLNHQQLNNMDFQKEVAGMLGLDQNTTGESVIGTLKAKLALAKQADSFKTKHDALKAEVDKMADEKLVQLVNLHQDKKFTADKRDFYINLGKGSGFDTLKGVIEALPDVVKPGNMINPKTNGGASEGGEVLTFAKLKEQGLPALEKFKQEKPAEYIKLYKAEYGVDPEDEN